MTEAADQHLPIGFNIEHYEIRAILGVGGFGITYKAWDKKLERWLAIKEFLPNELALRDRDNTTVRARSDKADDYQYALEKFLEEARTLAKFKHPNIVRVVDYLQANGTAYLIMEYVEGTSLSLHLRKTNARVSEEKLKTWFIPLLGGLSKVHDAGFLHRDIKPGNIYITEDDEPILIDFGAARQAIGEQTRSVTGIFTAGYAPIEQYSIDTKRQGPWTDLYAIGATLYRCISRTTPPDAPSRQAALMEGEKDPLTPAVDIGASLYSRNFLKLIDRLLLIGASERPISTSLVLDDLDKKEQPFNSTFEDEPETEISKDVVSEETTSSPPQGQSHLSRTFNGPGNREPDSQLRENPAAALDTSPAWRTALSIVVFALIILSISLAYIWRDDSRFRIQVLSYCDKSVKFRLHYQDVNDTEWTTTEEFTVAPNKKFFPRRSSDNNFLYTSAEHLYFYGEILDTNLRWSGEKQVSHNGKTHSMQKRMLRQRIEGRPLRIYCS